MAYQSLYRRYRPRRFSEMRGQDHLVAALHNAVRDDRVGHAYLFSGPRGTGKTTSARILAKALNCEALVDGEPCLECPSCVAIEAGTSFDLHELDAASNNGVEAMRDLISKTGIGTPGRTKIYILDEVHMLSAGASAALLKTLEEPPAHVVFVLATTDPQKVLPTIRSRTQHYELHLLPSTVMETHLRWVIKDAGLDVDEAAIAHVLRVGGGSARDTLSALDQVVAAGGIDDRTSTVDELLAALLERDPGAVLAAVHTAVGSGREPRVLGESLVTRLRDLFLASLGVPLDHLPEADRERVAGMVDGADRPFLTRALDGIGTALVEMRQAADPRITLETALVRLADVGADTSIASLLERIDRLERAAAAGGPVASASAAGPTPAPAPSTAAPAPGAPTTPPNPSTSPTTPSAGGSPAEEARRKLAARAGRTAPAPPAATPPPPTATAPAAPSATAPGSPPAAPPAVAATPSATAGTPGELPGLQELTAALPTLTGTAKARFAAGRFVAVADGAAVFALPNEMHRQRCEELRPKVEEMLAGRLGRPVPLRLVVDGGDRPTGGASDARSEPEEAHVDFDELLEAPAAKVRSGAQKLVEAFPGAEVVEDES